MVNLMVSLEAAVEAKLKNEQFGVEELSGQMNMSRSNLHRKLKQATGQSVSQFIREYRLKRGMEYLGEGHMTASEVSYQVGFGSPSYFTTCFTDFYGYPPGEAKHKLYSITSADGSLIRNDATHFKNRVLVIGSLIFGGLLIAFITYWQMTPIKRESDMMVASVDKSIAVLPFKNLNLDEGNEYLTLGIVGAISTHLSRIGDLRVISQLTADRYAGSSLSAKEIGKELGTTYLLRGSIQRDLNTVRIEVNLIYALSDEQIWAESYDQKFDDLLNIQSEIAEKVAMELNAKLSPEEKSVINENGTDNAKAYELYLQGKHILGTWEEDRFQQATFLFQQAIALDSAYAQAYVGLAASFMYRAGMCCSDLNPNVAFPLAKPQLEKALALNPELIEAHTWNGFYYLFGQWDFVRAEEEYNKASASDDSHGLGLHAIFLNFIGRHEESLVLSKRLNQTNPYYPLTRMPMSLFYLGLYDEAIEFARSRIKTYNNLLTHDNMGFIMLNTGDYVGAIYHFQEIIDLRNGIMYPRLLGWMGAAYARSGNRAKAFEFIEKLKFKKSAGEAGSMAFFIAVIYNALDDKASALHWLEESVNLHDMEVVWLKIEPQLFSLHDEPAFQELLERVGFP